MNEKHVAEYALVVRLTKEAEDAGFHGRPMPEEILNLRGGEHGAIQYFRERYATGAEMARVAALAAGETTLFEQVAKRMVDELRDEAVRQIRQITDPEKRAEAAYQMALREYKLSHTGNAVMRPDDGKTHTSDR